MKGSSAKVVMERIRSLGQISEELGLTRTYGSDAMRRANALVAEWMRLAGMSVRLDNIGNLLGTYSVAGSKPKTLLLGSHLDTVRNAGIFDGALGVLAAIAVVHRLHREKIRLPFNLQVAGFCDEEGVRFQSTYLGSRVLAGTFAPADLKQTDDTGVSLREAIRRFGGKPGSLAQSRLHTDDLIGYVEVHIEQGPVLEHANLAIGVVKGIAGQTRCAIQFTGRAGHAGTVPMRLRRDALCAAAEFTLGVENFAGRSDGLVATVGKLNALPGASNVIPGEVHLSLDVRHARDTVRLAGCARIRAMGEKLARRRGVKMRWQTVHECAAVACDPALSTLLMRAAAKHQPGVIFLASGAGHDAAAMAAITPVAMLFVRCKGGISHHPDESASQQDIGIAIETMSDFIAALAKKS